MDQRGKNPRLFITETGWFATKSPKYCKFFDKTEIAWRGRAGWLAGAPGFEPGNGRIKIRVSDLSSGRAPGAPEKILLWMSSILDSADRDLTDR